MIDHGYPIMHAMATQTTWDLPGTCVDPSFTEKLNQLVKITVTTLTASRMAVKRDRLDLLRKTSDPHTHWNRHSLTLL